MLTLYMKLNDDLDWSGNFVGLVDGLGTLGDSVAVISDLPISLTITRIAKARYQIIDSTGANFIALAVVTDQGHMLYEVAIGGLATTFFKVKHDGDHRVKEFTDIRQQPGDDPVAGVARVGLSRYRRTDV
ncbi:MAG: hypothetical protein ACYCOU_15805 [Sulfobacillus sp.]